MSFVRQLPHDWTRFNQADIQFYNFWSWTKSKTNVPEQYLSGSQPTSWAVGGEQEGVSARAGEPLHCCGCHHHQLTLTQWVRAATIPKTLLMCTSLPKLSNQLRSFTTFSSLRQSWCCLTCCIQQTVSIFSFNPEWYVTEPDTCMGANKVFSLVAQGYIKVYRWPPLLARPQLRINTTWKIIQVEYFAQKAQQWHMGDPWWVSKKMVSQKIAATVATYRQELPTVTLIDW